MASPALAATNYPLVGSPSIMDQKEHGTCVAPAQDNLRFGSDFKTADRIGCYNRNWAEFAGYAFSNDKTWTKEVLNSSSDRPVTYYDSVTGKPLFRGPVGRST